MLNLPTLVLILIFVAGCSGAGGFNQGFNGGKKEDGSSSGGGSPEQKTNQQTPEGESKADDTADQPIHISGTYLTCAETSEGTVESPATATFGCRLASKSDGKTVALNRLATDWIYDFEVKTEQQEQVAKRMATPNDKFQVYYDFEAPTSLALKNLVMRAIVSLDLDLLPGAGVDNGQPEFRGPLPGFVPQGESEVISGSQEKLTDDIVLSPQATPAPSTTQTVQIPAPSPQPVPSSLPTPAPENQPPPANIPNSPSPSPSTSSVNVASNDPVVTFSVTYSGGSAMALNAVFDQEELTDPIFSGGGSMSVSDIQISNDGSASYRLSSLVSVSVKKGPKVCTASGVIGGSNMSLPLSCK